MVQLESRIMPFGIHKGEPLRRVPINYWEWLSGQDWVAQKFPFVWTYCLSRIEPREEQEGGV
jgi:uncharacterized protein (DUF3820 family)